MCELQSKLCCNAQPITMSYCITLIWGQALQQMIVPHDLEFSQCKSSARPWFWHSGIILSHHMMPPTLSDEIYLRLLLPEALLSHDVSRNHWQFCPILMTSVNMDYLNYGNSCKHQTFPMHMCLIHTETLCPDNGHGTEPQNPECIFVLIWTVSV